MRKRTQIKNHYQEIQLTTRRSVIALLIMCCLVFALIFRLAFLQINKHNAYSTMAVKNWLDLVPVEPTRGLIYDRNGLLIAENVPIFSLDITPSQTSNIDETINKLKAIITFSESEIKQFKRQVRQHRRYEAIPLKLSLTEIEAARFAENQHQFPGVAVNARLIRRYPQGDTYDHVLGYVGRINSKELNQIDQSNYSASLHIGKLGIEKFYENQLHGKVGYQEIENDASGKTLRILKEIKATPGTNLYLTIDSKLQKAAKNALKDKRGAIVAIDPKTGEILAMVSQPGYDPNLFVTGMSHKDYHTLQHSIDRPLYDRALRGLYPIASTIKPFMALEALNAEVITPDETIYDPGWFQLPNSSHRYHDWLYFGHGEVDLNKALVRSCDTYFYELARRMGIRHISSILSQFGFGELSGIDISGELSGIVPTPEWKLETKGTRWYDGDTIISGIGQGFVQATPLQLASATAALANRGIRFAPHLVKGKQIPGKDYQVIQPQELAPVLINHSEDWDNVISALEESVSSPRGTSRRFGRTRYKVAAKTGTAQIISKQGSSGLDDQSTIPERLRDHHLFIAFAPSRNPKIAVAVITENSNDAVTTAREVFDSYFGPEPQTAMPEPNNVKTD